MEKAFRYLREKSAYFTILIGAAFGIGSQIYRVWQEEMVAIAIAVGAGFAALLWRKLQSLTTAIDRIGRGVDCVPFSDEKSAFEFLANKVRSAQKCIDQVAIAPTPPMPKDILAGY